MHRPRHRRIGVPKGLLRHLTLYLLKQKPMSGSELMDSIQEYTEWRPSPGSMYPLIASMQEEGLIKPFEDEDPTLKRIELTEQGTEELDWWTQHDEHFRSRNRSMRKMFWLLHKGMPTDVYTSFSKLLTTVEESLPGLTSENKQTFIDTFEDAAGRISEV